MPQVKKAILAPYSQQQMFELVNDVAAYPEFLPFCSDSKILEQTDDVLTASLTLAKGGLSKTFTTRNQLTPYSEMVVSLVDGPFKTLDGYWRFIESEQGYVQVCLDMHYEFDSKMLALVFGPLFAQVAGSLVDAFLDRAKVVFA